MKMYKIDQIMELLQLEKNQKIAMWVLRIMTREILLLY